MRILVLGAGAIGGCRGWRSAGAAAAAPVTVAPVGQGAPMPEAGFAPPQIHDAPGAA